MKKEQRAKEWDVSYRRGDNFVFYPDEQIVRFFSKYVRKRTGVRKFENRDYWQPRARVLDLGCGIGRHVHFVSELGLRAFGIDHSSAAIHFAKRWAKTNGNASRRSRFQIGATDRLPWKTGAFHFVLAHAVLDSMSRGLAEASLLEVARVLSPGGLFFCDLLALRPGASQNEEWIVRERFEKGTVQPLYTLPKARRLFSRAFDILEVVSVERQFFEGGKTKRNYFVLKPKKLKPAR